MSVGAKIVNRVNPNAPRSIAFIKASTFNFVFRAVR